MSTLKILHAADLHLDSPFEGLPAGKASVRRSEQRVSSLAKASCEKNKRCLVCLILSANVIFIVSLAINTHDYSLILASIRRLVNKY